MEKIVVAVKALIIRDEKVLITKRADKDEVGAGTWEIPGGKIEFGEKLEDALLREVSEEAGININIEKLLYACTFLTDSSRQVVILTYLCNTDNKVIILSDEHSEFLWASKAQLMEYLTPEILVDFKNNDIFSLNNIK